MVSEKETPGGKAKPETAATPAPTPAPEAVKAAPESTASEAAPEAAPEAVAETAASEAAPAAPASTEARAAEIIRKHVLMSAAAGVIPLNFVDTAALAVVQLRLLKELSELHGVDFRGDIGRSAVGTLFATVAPTALAGGLLGSLALRSVPVIGTITRLATQPAFNSAFTYALGKVFQQHFASGGTFLTFQPEKVKTYFREKFEEARRRKGAAPEATPAAA